MKEVLSFAELLSARLCHDLASPIGAANNGLEFANEADDAETQKQALQIASQSCAQAVARLNFYRHIYSPPAQECMQADLAKMQQTAAAFFAINKITIHWPAVKMALTMREAQLLLNLLSILASSLLKGGGLYVNSQGNVSIIAKGESINLKENIVHIFHNNANEEITTENVHLHFTAKLAQSLGAKLQLTKHATEATLTIDLQRKI